MYLDQGADINFQNSGIFSSEETACMKAAENGQLEAIKYLVERGADFHLGNSGGEIPLTRAASKDHQEVVLYLISKGEDINYQESNYGMTPLLHAVSYGDVSYIRQLISNGADKDVRDKNGNTPMTLAAFSHQPAAIRYLAGIGSKNGKTLPGK